MQADNIFKCFKIDTLIINRVFYKLGQLQYLVRAFKGKWQVCYTLCVTVSSIFNVYVILRFRCAQLVWIWHVVSFFSLFNFLFLKLQFMRIKMYILAVFAQYTACPSHHLTLVVSALQHAAPKIRNSLPPSLRTCTSPDTFRRYLKTHYCQQAFQST